MQGQNLLFSNTSEIQTLCDSQTERLDNCGRESWITSKKKKTNFPIIKIGGKKSPKKFLKNNDYNNNSYLLSVYVSFYFKHFIDIILFNSHNNVLWLVLLSPVNIYLFI